MNCYGEIACDAGRRIAIRISSLRVRRGLRRLTCRGSFLRLEGCARVIRM
jgi:hypothetical protein